MNNAFSSTLSFQFRIQALIVVREENKRIEKSERCAVIIVCTAGSLSAVPVCGSVQGRAGNGTFPSSPASSLLMPCTYVVACLPMPIERLLPRKALLHNVSCRDSFSLSVVPMVEFRVEYYAHIIMIIDTSRTIHDTKIARRLARLLCLATRRPMSFR